MQATRSCCRRPRIRRAHGSPAQADYSAWCPRHWARTRRTVTFINRYYDPTTAQFISIDPLVSETAEPYSYAGGDPLNRSDPLGLTWCDFSPVGCGEAKKVAHNPGAVASDALTLVGKGATTVTVLAASAAGASALTPDADFMSAAAALAIADGAGAIAAGADLLNCAAFKSCDRTTLTIDLLALVPGLGFVKETTPLEQGAVAGWEWLLGVLGINHDVHPFCTLPG